MTPCVTLARMLAELLHKDTLLQQIAHDNFGRPWTVQMGADRRKILPDKLCPMLLVLPEDTHEGDLAYASSTLRVVMALVCDAITDELPRELLGLSILDEQTRPQVLHLIDSIPSPVTRAEWMSEIDIESFPLIIQTLEITIHERLPIGHRRY